MEMKSAVLKLIGKHENDPVSFRRYITNIQYLLLPNPGNQKNNDGFTIALYT